MPAGSWLKSRRSICKEERPWEPSRSPGAFVCADKQRVFARISRRSFFLVDFLGQREEGKASRGDGADSVQDAVTGAAITAKDQTIELDLRPCQLRALLLGK
jgi:hypothetical protein